MKFPGFWPEGSKIITNVQSAQHELRQKDIARLQDELKMGGLDMAAPIRKAKLAELFKLMEEDEVARGGPFTLNRCFTRLAKRKRIGCTPWRAGLRTIR